MVFAVMAVPTFLVVRSWFESEKEKGLREINENEENDEKTSFEWYTGEIRSLKAEMEEADWWQWFINNVAIIVLTPLASVVLYSFFHILPMEPATRNTTVEEITD
uniref:Transmembrane protein n=1 Tax=Caenorhabditis tropicalis TaxID=1561998 RepID=A0A1I7UI42_9PELO